MDMESHTSIGQRIASWWDKRGQCRIDHRKRSRFTPAQRRVYWRVLWAAAALWLIFEVALWLTNSDAALAANAWPPLHQQTLSPAAMNSLVALRDNLLGSFLFLVFTGLFLSQPDPRHHDMQERLSILFPKLSKFAELAKPFEIQACAAACVTLQSMVELNLESFDAATNRFVLRVQKREELANLLITEPYEDEFFPVGIEGDAHPGTNPADIIGELSFARLTASDGRIHDLIPIGQPLVVTEADPARDGTRRVRLEADSGATYEVRFWLKVAEGVQYTSRLTRAVGKATWTVTNRCTDSVKLEAKLDGETVNAVVQPGKSYSWPYRSLSPQRLVTLVFRRL